MKNIQVRWWMKERISAQDSNRNEAEKENDKNKRNKIQEKQ